MALAGQLDKKDYYVYVLTGDGEHQSGQIWEAVMEAAHYKLDNLVNILDRNKLQIDGEVEKVMKVEPLKEKYESFGWRVIEIDGHEIDEILTAFEQAKTKEAKPTLILAETIKGKGVSFMEGKAEWHGKAPNYDQMVKGLEELGVKDEIPFEEFLAEAKKYQQEVNKKLEDKRPKFKKDYRWNKNEVMKVEMKRTRQGFGVALEKLGEEEAVVCVSHDLTGSINMDSFFKHHPERKERFFNMGVAEQSGTGVAAGLAKAGKLSIFGTYGVFSAGRNLDQLRISVCYSGANVLIIGAHGGILVGADGATHQATEDLFQVCGLPKMKVEVPCDFLETQKAARHLLLSEKGPKYLRYAREATPLVTDEKTPFIFGQANIIRYQGEKENFIDAFKTTLSSEYKTENEDLTIIACGPEVAEAMRAAYILKEEKGVEARVINMHTLKPLDEEAVIKAAQETGIILTAEDHQVGGLGYRISSVISQSTELYGQPVILKMLGLKDKFGTSGSPWELLEEFELSAEYIADKALFLLELKK
jgi:transketolase